MLESAIGPFLRDVLSHEISDPRSRSGANAGVYLLRDSRDHFGRRLSAALTPPSQAYGQYHDAR